MVPASNTGMVNSTYSFPLGVPLLGADVVMRHGTLQQRDELDKDDGVSALDVLEDGDLCQCIGQFSG